MTFDRATVSTWLDQAAIPYWLAHGIDRDGGGFHEVLDFSGKPVEAEKRLRTMARQTYSFASAVQRGWGDGDAARDAVAHGLQFLNRQARLDDGTYAKTFVFDGTVKDRTRDTYDYAFLLFAAAAAMPVHPEDATQLGTDVMRQLEADFYLGESLGYREIGGEGDGTDADGIRRANPHMHLLEAFTAWHRATGDALAHTRAQEIVALFYKHFFDQDTWSLREFMDARLQPIDGKRGTVREPGHAFEWAWLLHDFERASAAKTKWTAQRLIASAEAFGTNPVTGLTYQEVTAHGDVLDDGSRSWPQTEAVRAMLTLKQLGLSHQAANVNARLATLFHHHITPAPEGLWFDRIGADGTVESESVPASILYHMISAFTAVLDDGVA